jgi:hypothetical protein
MTIGAHLGQGRVHVFAVVYERSVVRRIGVDSGSWELFVPNPPPSPDRPRKFPLSVFRCE